MSGPKLYDRLSHSRVRKPDEANQHHGSHVPGLRRRLRGRLAAEAGADRSARAPQASSVADFGLSSFDDI
jgi:hypothetical protein